MIRALFAVFALYVLPVIPLFSQEASGVSGDYRSPELKLDLLVFDLPYQIDVANTSNNFFGAYSTLSMNQSLSLTAGVYSSMHYGMKKLYDNLSWDPILKDVVYYGGTAAGLFAFALALPFGYPWMRQEYTRSVLARFGVNSINGAYNIFDTIGGVHGVADDDLVRLKAESPQDLIRMEEASIEGYLLLSGRMIRNSFFYNLDDLSVVTAFLSAYFGVSLHSANILADEYGFIDIDSMVKDWNKDDGPQKNRSPSGSSDLNWVYDLFRPDEPYADRGTHPSGDGIARYIAPSQLSDSERDYLIKQAWLSYLNFVSPALYGVNSFPWGETGVEWNAALNHYFTSFGSDTPLQILVKRAPFNIAFTLHNYMNYENYFPALEAELFDFPLRAGGLDIYLSPRVLVGMQPANQEFMTGSPAFLGLFGLRADFGLSGHFLPYIDLSAKTSGWVAGNEYLDSNVSVRLGVSMRF
jgi:hypothetical protein